MTTMKGTFSTELIMCTLCSNNTNPWYSVQYYPFHVYQQEKLKFAKQEQKADKEQAQGMDILKSETGPKASTDKDLSEIHTSGKDLTKKKDPPEEAPLTEYPKRYEKPRLTRLDTNIKNFCIKLERFKQDKIEQGHIAQTPCVF